MKKANGPARETEQLLEWARQYYARFAGEIEGPVIAKAQGARMWDTEGREYIDLSSGQMCATVGHNHPKVVEALRRSPEGALHLNSKLLSPPVVELARRLAGLLPPSLRKTILLSTGSESVEVALKLAKINTGRYEVVGLDRSYHGHTGGALAATFSQKRVGFGPLVPGNFAIPAPYCYRCPLNLTFPSCDYACARVGFALVDSQSTGSLAAFVAEPILSGGGMIEPPPGYFKFVAGLARQRGMFVIFDEAQTGLGRVGATFAFQQEEVVPDLLALSKTLGGGIPLAATCMSDEIEEMAIKRGYRFRTSHMSEPMPAAIGLAVLDILEEERLVQQSQEKGAYLKRHLLELKEEHRLIGDVRGRGLFLGVEFVRDPATREPAVGEGKEVTRRCLEKGLVVDETTAGKSHIWRVAPPLTISYEEMDRAVAIMDAALQEMGG